MNQEQAPANQQAPTNRGPGLLRQAGNFARAAVRHAADGGRKVADDVYFARLVICGHCASVDPDRVVCTERKCGCRLLTKARWRSEKCPLDQWPE